MKLYHLKAGSAIKPLDPQGGSLNHHPVGSFLLHKGRQQGLSMGFGICGRESLRSPLHYPYLLGCMPWYSPLSLNVGRMYALLLTEWQRQWDGTSVMHSHTAGGNVCLASRLSLPCWL